jgi:hypothetical protein
LAGSDGWFDRNEKGRLHGRRCREFDAHVAVSRAIPSRQDLQFAWLHRQAVTCLGALTLRCRAMTHKWRVVSLRSVLTRGGLATIHKTLSVRFLRHPFLSQSILPEIPEAGGRKLSVANCVLDVLVPEIVL